MPRKPRDSQKKHRIASEEIIAEAVAPLESIPSPFSRLFKRTPEQQFVVKPFVEYLIEIGWAREQMVFGKQEWCVPKRPSEASRREKGHSFEGYPVDIAIFDNARRVGDPRAASVIVECKQPDETTGIAQLETYLSLEPHAVLGVWTNSPDPSAPAVFVYRKPKGGFLLKRRPLGDFPRPTEKISPDEKRLLFDDLTRPSADALRRIVEEILDHVVANDSLVTRREEQLDQICGLLLLKLDSDKQAKASRTAPPYFRPRLSASETAIAMRSAFQDLANLYPAVFREPADKQLKLGDETINKCVERLASYRLIDVGVSTIAMAFQVLRAAALKQGEGQYFTPEQVIHGAIRLLDIQWNDIVIDPACGTGGFLVESLLEMQRKYEGQEAEIARWAQMHLYGIDKDGIGVKLTKAIMQIAGDGSANCVRGDSVRTHEWATKYRELTGGNYDDGRFTVVVTNPPFGVKLKLSASESRLSDHSIAKAGTADYHDLEIGLIFLERAYDLLRVGGRVGIILPETYFFSDGYQFVIDWIRPRLRPTVVLNIPMEAFQGFCRAKTNFYIFEKMANEEDI